MNTDSSAKSARPAWAEAVAQYQTPIVWTSVWQIVNSFVPFVVIWTLAYRDLRVMERPVATPAAPIPLAPAHSAAD